MTGVDGSPDDEIGGASAGSMGQFEVTDSAVLGSLSEVVYALDDAGRLVSWNDRLEAVTGFDADALAGRAATSLVADHDDEAVASCLDRVLDDGETVRVEVALVTADGDSVPHRLTASPIVEGGTTVGVAGTAFDVSDVLARERAFAEENARLERFASIVSHDLRNPLAVADGYLELAKAESDAPYLDEIREAHDRMEQLIDSVLTLAREGEGLDEPTTVDLTGVATDAWDAVETGDATLQVRDLGTVVGDRSQLRQLFENLFRNSIEHGSVSSRDGDRRSDDSGDGGGPSVTVTVEPTDGGFYVADDGPGFPDDQGDPFEHGVTTSDDGTGLGLSIVESVATSHGWTVDASSSEDGGARIDVRT